MDGSGLQWSLLTIVGPIVLAAAILWAILRNRRASQAQIDRTEQATRDMQQRQDAIDKAKQEQGRR